MPTLEERVDQLERQMLRLLEREQQPEQARAEPWWMRHSGAFENSALYDEAMRRGSEYRRAQPTPADSAEEFTD
jgi:hypothetical protein